MEIVRSPINSHGIVSEPVNGSSFAFVVVVVAAGSVVEVVDVVTTAAVVDVVDDVVVLASVVDVVDVGSVVDVVVVTGGTSVRQSPTGTTELPIPTKRILSAPLGRVTSPRSDTFDTDKTLSARSAVGLVVATTTPFKMNSSFTLSFTCVALRRSSRAV